MRVIRILLLVGITAGAEADAQSETGISTSLQGLVSLSGHDYIRARENLLRSGRADALAQVINRLHAVEHDPIQQLWLECLLDRLTQLDRVDDLWRTACEEAALPKPTAAGLRVLPPTSQASWVAGKLIGMLGARAPLYATERLERNLRFSDSDAEQLVPIVILGEFGWKRDPSSSPAEPRFFPPAEPRAGLVLLRHALRLALDEPEPMVHRELMLSLARFADARFLRAAAEERDQLPSGNQKVRFSAILEELQARLILAEQATSRPAGSPDVPHHLGPPQGWRERLKGYR